MTILIVGLVLFFAVHFVPSMTGLKQALTGRFGTNGYRGVFSVVATLGLVLIIWGFSRAEWIDVYEPPWWGRYLTMTLVLVAFICMAAFNLRGRIKRALRHPMLIGITIWGIGHLFANGDLASVLLFGSFVVFGILDIFLANAQNRVAVFEVKPMHDVLAVIVGTGAYVVFLFLHPYVIGVPVIQV